MNERDPVRLLLIQEIVEEVQEQEKIRDHNLAVKIVDNVGKLLNG